MNRFALCLLYCRALLDAKLHASRRRTMGVVCGWIGFGVFVLWAAVAFVPAPAAADFITTFLAGGTGTTDPNSLQSELNLSLDPTTVIDTMAQSWWNDARDIANHIYAVLLVIELFMFGLQAILFREGVERLFASMTFKIFTIGFFLFLISNSETLFHMVIGSFSQGGAAVAGYGTPSPTGDGPIPSAKSALVAFLIKAIGLAAALFAVGMIGQQVDENAAEGCNNIREVIKDPGAVLHNVTSVGCATSLPFAHLLYDLACFGMAMMVLGSAGILLLTLTLLTTESYIVMGAGVVFLGFAGSRFTMSFSQGYMSYAVTVGAKLFTFWLIVYLENKLWANVLVDAAGSVIMGFIAGKFGDPHDSIFLHVLSYAGAAAALGAAAMAVFQCVMMSALAYAVPNIAGTFLSGKSQLSAARMLSGAINSLGAAATSVSALRGFMARSSSVQNKLRSMRAQEAQSGSGDAESDGGGSESDSAAGNPTTSGTVDAPNSGSDQNRIPATKENLANGNVTPADRERFAKLLEPKQDAFTPFSKFSDEQLRIISNQPQLRELAQAALRQRANRHRQQLQGAVGNASDWVGRIMDEGDQGLAHLESDGPAVQIRTNISDH